MDDLKLWHRFVARLAFWGTPQDGGELRGVDVRPAATARRLPLGREDDPEARLVKVPALVRLMVAAHSLIVLPAAGLCCARKLGFTVDWANDGDQNPVHHQTWKAAMIEEMQAAMTAVGALREIVKVSFNAKVDAKSSERVFEAMDKLGTVSDTLYSMRDEMFRLQAENEKLRREARDQQALQEKLQKYALEVTPGGAVVQIHKEDPPHFACPVCINTGRIEVLQPRVVRGRHVCPSCAAQYAVEPLAPKPKQPSRPPPVHWMAR